jgi:hypothetical protein
METEPKLHYGEEKQYREEALLQVHHFVFKMSMSRQGALGTSGKEWIP